LEIKMVKEKSRFIEQAYAMLDLRSYPLTLSPKGRGN